MTYRSFFLCLLASSCLLAGCPSMGGVDGGADSGTPDTGAPVDVGTDAGSPTDTGMVGVDAIVMVDVGGNLDGGTGTDAPAGAACGARLGPCAGANSFCDFAGDGCDFADATGVCRPRPTVCPRIFDPVCGCDGMTYDNECSAQAAGVDAASRGACTSG